MEQTNTNAETIMSNPETTNENPPSQDQEHRALHKKKGNKNIFKLALFMMRSSRSKSKKSKTVLPSPLNDESRDTWKTLVGSMRPLHLQSNQSPKHHDNNSQQLMRVTSPRENDREEVFDSVPNTPCRCSASSSRYASAVGLNELVEDEEIQNEEEDDVEGKDDGDEMIDAKAEEFIARFYQQMKMQHLEFSDLD